jgi:serine phosphatase RsbU (regulator of sigma subunit)
MIDPIRFKKILVQLLKLLIVIELVNAMVQGSEGHGWARFGFDLLVAGVLYLTWGRITILLRGKKKEFREKMERSLEHIGLWDAWLFSLLWSDEIYREIPADRRRLVVISYTLITLGLVAAFINFGTGLMPLVVSGALVLGAVNLVIWVVSLEREGKETLATELKLARDVQASLMPRSDPSVPGFDIAGMSLPAQEVGGDLFDYCCLGLDNKHFGVSVFDVSGKGMQAAMSAVFTSGALASEATRSTSPAAILTSLNTAVYTHSRRGHFVAFLLAMIDTGTRTITFSNAGQTKPLVRSASGIQWLDSVGIHFPLGMKEDSVFEERTVQLASGDILFLFTDGFTDAMNPARDVYGIERMEQLALNPELCRKSAQEILTGMTDAIRLHMGAAPQHDDMTMVVVKVA